LTHAARRSSTSIRAIRTDSSSDPQVLKTTILSVISKIAETNSTSDATIIFQASLEWAGCAAPAGSVAGCRVPMRRSFPKYAYLIALVLVLGYAIVALRGPNGVSALAAKQAEIEKLEKDNAALARDVERRREKIKRLLGNPAEQQLEVQRRLGYVNPKDKVFVTGKPEKK
jgi:cell division protein FtsB